MVPLHSVNKTKLISQVARQIIKIRVTISGGFNIVELLRHCRTHRGSCETSKKGIFSGSSKKSPFADDCTWRSISPHRMAHRRNPQEKLSPCCCVGMRLTCTVVPSKIPAPVNLPCKSNFGGSCVCLGALVIQAVSRSQTVTVRFGGMTVTVRFGGMAI